MAFPPSQNGSYVPGQSPVQEQQHPHGHQSATGTASPLYFRLDQHQSAPAAQFMTYAQPPQQLQAHATPTGTPAPIYPPRPGSELHPAPPNAILQHGPIPAAPAAYYNTSSHPDLYASPHLQYQAPPPPRPQPRSQTQLKHPSSSPYPRIQIRPPPPSQLQRLSNINKSPTPPQRQLGVSGQAGDPMSSNASQQTKPSKARDKCDKQSTDYQVLLLSLADEYFDAAHSQGTVLAASRQEGDIEQYHKLIATGLCCLEVVLKNWRLQPRTEGLLRLRYARILYEETNNDLQAETALSKGIDLCERNRMFGLKYSMQQLQCRILYKSNPKAAIKMVDGIIRDIEAYRHIAWEYAFRLLRVTFSLSSPFHQDLVGALQNLQKVSTIASRTGDKAVVAVSSIIESLVHLQQSSSSDSIEQAQRAIATARSHQLDGSVGDIPHIHIMIQIIDICCSVLEYDINQAAQKLQVLQKNMDQNLSNSLWRDDGSFIIPLSSEAVKHSAIEIGDILRMDNDKPVMTFNWLPEIDLYALCYFLSSVTLGAKNSQDGHKAEKYLQEGLRMIKSNFESPQEVSESLMFATSRLHWRRLLHCHMLLQQIFLACARTDWSLAHRSLKQVQNALPELGGGPHDTIHCLIQYSMGVIAQATGDLKRALAIFQQPMFALSPSVNKTSRNDPRRDTAILAGLNCVLIYRDPSQSSYPIAADTLGFLEPFCQNTPNKYVHAAYSLISATIQTESTMQTKRNLHQSLQAATAICNSQVTCLALTFMSWKYFRGVVGEQSEKSAMAAKAMARKTDDKLWISVTDELLAETLERQGKSSEAAMLRERADRDLASLPPVLMKAAKSASSQNGSSAEVRLKEVRI